MSTKTVVTCETVEQIVKTLCERTILVFDTETSGLSSFHNSEMFSIAFSDLKGNAYYFNFQANKDIEPKYVLPLSCLVPLFAERKIWIAHNAKFDLHMLKKAGFELQGTHVDTKVLARVYQNQWSYSGGYSLDACAKRWLSIEKDDRVKAYMDEHGLYTTNMSREGKASKDYKFYLVPFEIISEYAMQDAIVTAELFNFFKENMYPNKIVDIEMALTPVLYRMEQTGVLVDRDYIDEAMRYESARAEDALGALQHTFPGFTDSAKFLEPVFQQLGIPIKLTEKGEVETSDKILRPHESIPFVKLLLEYRDAAKRAGTYFGNYRDLCDANGVIHPNFNQDGTGTGRMSCTNPNLQNIPSDDGGPYPVRKGFIASPGFKLVGIDYKQMEFRLVLEYARELGLIEQIKAGHDPHDATAQLTGLDRKTAKTLNFALLYGVGLVSLAYMLLKPTAEESAALDEYSKLPDKRLAKQQLPPDIFEVQKRVLDQVKAFKYKYFDALPGVKKFLFDVPERVSMRGYGINLYERRSYLEDKKWAYKAANAIIQGGCADIVKDAMVRLDTFLAPMASRMILQIHDEIIFEIHESEMHVIKEIKFIMETTYKHKHLPMECSVEISDNLQDMEAYDDSQIPARESAPEPS